MMVAVTPNHRAAVKVVLANPGLCPTVIFKPHSGAADC